MRTTALEFFACPRCGGALVADAAPPEPDGHIMTGVLVSGCGARFSIERGVPRLAPTAGASDDGDVELGAEVASRFGQEWSIFDHKESYYEQQFVDWIAPLSPPDFRDQVVFEGGCGKGRHTSLVAGYGARAVVSIDLGSAVDVAFSATRHLTNVHIAQGDITAPPVGRVFDVGFSIGVLHHVPEPRRGFRGLCDRIRVGGRVAIWVYGYESNEWIVRYVDPVRKRVTSRISENLLYWLSLPPSLALSAALRLYRSPGLARRLPYGAYLGYISRFPRREVHHILFDQLVTPVAHYVPRGEVEQWFASTDFDQVSIAWHNRNSWRASALVRGHDDLSSR